MSMQARTLPALEALDLPELETELDDQHPWPGLEGYQEGDEGFFKGRSSEVEDLYRLIRRERLTLLFGKAGTGKTSLIRAGLFPKQRREEALPVHVRLDYSEDAPTLGAQVKTAIHRAAQEAKLDAPEPTDDVSLWEYLHLSDGEFWSPHHRIIMPFIVFDQFEEIFTHAPAEPGSPREADLKLFKSELSDLAEDRVPAGLHEDKSRIARCNLDRHHYKLVVCLQEEHLADLDRMRDDFPPALFRNRMRLTEMTLEQAKEVVAETGKQVGADALADEIAERASRDTREQGRDTELGRTKPSVSPALLAVLCTTLNRKRLDEGAARITRGHLEAVGPSILAGFYEQRLESLPAVPDEGGWRPGRTRTQEVNDRIEREFVDGKVRKSIPESRALAVFGAAALAQLLKDKVLGHTPHGRVELLHDVLPETVGRTKGRFLGDWVDRLVRNWIPGTAIGALVAGGVLGYVLAGGSEPPVRPIPITDTSGPTTPNSAYVFSTNIVRELNAGTNDLRLVVEELGGGDFGEAAAVLAGLEFDLVGRRDLYCRGTVDYPYAGVNEVMDHGCDAFGRQEELRGILADRVVSVGPSSLTDPGTRDEVVEAWMVGESTFEGLRDQINVIVAVWDGLRTSAER